MLTTRRGLAGRGVSCLVADVLASWAVPVATRCGVPAVGFWPAMLATYRVVAGDAYDRRCRCSLLFYDS